MAPPPPIHEELGFSPDIEGEGSRGVDLAIATKEANDT